MFLCEYSHMSARVFWSFNGKDSSDVGTEITHGIAFDAHE